VFLIGWGRGFGNLVAPCLVLSPACCSVLVGGVCFHRHLVVAELSLSMVAAFALFSMVD